MDFKVIDDVRVILPRAALTAIFDECDGFERDETGGRIIGTYETHGDLLTIHVTGIIGPGPGARRTPVSFFQDGEHQERVFRRIERDHPEIEHLGNWHTHHVNGMPRLSDGDIATYQRTVCHQNHNTDFFYALLVVAKRDGGKAHDRYSVKHYLIRRNDEGVYEIAPRRVEVIEEPLVWPMALEREVDDGNQPSRLHLAARSERVFDQGIVRECYQGFRAYTSRRLGFYWRGPVEFIDGTQMEVVVLEGTSSHQTTYSVALRNPPDALKAIAADLAEREFSSAPAALIVTERICNKALYGQRKTLKHHKHSRSRG